MRYLKPSRSQQVHDKVNEIFGGVKSTMSEIDSIVMESISLIEEVLSLIGMFRQLSRINDRDSSPRLRDGQGH